MVGQIVAAATPMPTPTPGPTGSVLSPSIPTVLPSGSTTADWLSAWGQVGGAIFTALALAAALWINRRTRLALDDERLARQQEISRLDGEQRDRNSRTLLTDIDQFVVAVLEFRSARRVKAVRHWMALGVMLLSLTKAVGGLIRILEAFERDVQRDSKGEGSETWDLALEMQFWTHARAWVAGGESLAPEAALARVSLAHSRLRELAHPDLLQRADEVTQSCHTFNSVRGSRHPLAAVRADTDIEHAIVRLQQYVKTGPLLALR